MSENVYPFIGGDPIEERHSYAYVPFRGAKFLDDWRNARSSVKARLGEAASAAPAPVRTGAPEMPTIHTSDVLEYLMRALDAAALNADEDAWLDWCIERFEVSKRVFSAYSLAGERARGKGGYQDLALYVRLAEVLAKSFQTVGRLPALNALIKCMDTLCSHADRLAVGEKSRLARLISLERSFVDGLREPQRAEHALGGFSNERSTQSGPFGTSSSGRSGKLLDDTVLLVADTLRSRGYAQALRAEGFTLRGVVVIGATGERRWGQADSIPSPPAAEHFPNLFVPDLREPLLETCVQLSDCVEFIDSGTVNALDVRKRLAELDPALVIYSGFGGELVQSDLLDAAGPLLHMHAGWLPEYRGSTTIYYSLLRESACGVSAILLTPQIDAGEILLRRWYPPPPFNVDLDYYYDSIVRSDALIQVLGNILEKGQLPEGTGQDETDGQVYYIIHPLLKHVAILSLVDNVDAREAR